MNTMIKGVIAAAALATATTSGIFIGQAMADQPHMQAALDALIGARDQPSRRLPTKAAIAWQRFV